MYSMSVDKIIIHKSSDFQKSFLSCSVFSTGLKKQKTCSLIYLHLQKVVELLTCGRKGLRSAELKVPQLILCSERNKTTVNCKGTQKREET